MNWKNFNYGLVIAIILCLLFWLTLLGGCSGQRYTKQVLDNDGKLVKVIVIDTWCILREFNSDGSSLIIKDGLYQLQLNDESNSSKVRVVTPYGTGEIE